MAQRMVRCLRLAAPHSSASRSGQSQVRQISGRVTNAQTEQGLSEATIAVVGTQIVAQAGNDGRFTLNAPEGDANLMVRGIGYKRQQVSVPAGQASVDVALEPDVFKLEEIVITGQATGVEQQNLPNAVATVDAGELTRAPTPTLESALQGKIPGALIQANSGAPGGGIQLSLRGVSTIIGSVGSAVRGRRHRGQQRGDPQRRQRGELRPVRRQPAQPGQPGQPHRRPQPGGHRADRGPQGRLGRGDLRLQGHERRRHHHDEAGPGRASRSSTSRSVSGVTERSNELGQPDVRLLAEALTFSSDTALVTSLFQPGRTFDAEKEVFGHKPVSYETDASVSGGTESTKYYVSALVKDDGGIATNTGYKKQSLRSNIDQELGSGFQLAVNLSGTHSLSRRGLTNNDNSGTSPFLVFPFTPSFVDLLPAANKPTDSLIPADFPVNPFERSNPLQTFQFLKNDEDVWRLLGTSTLRWSAVRSAKSNLQLIGIGGVDYFQQDNNLVSPPELQFEPNDGQPGTVVLSKSSNRNLNLALNATHTLLPGDPDHGSQWTTSAGIQFEERRLFATQVLGRTLLTGQAEPAAGGQPDGPQPDRAGARPRRLRRRRRCCWPTGGCCSPRGSGPTAAAPTATPTSTSSTPSWRRRTGSCGRSAGSTSSSCAARTGRRATGRCSARST